MENVEDNLENLKKAIIIRYSEIAVKGRGTRRRMENLLVSNLRESLKRERVEAKISLYPGRIILWNPSSEDKAVEAARLVFGVKSVSPARATSFSSIDDIVKIGVKLYKNKIYNKIFRVRARRSGRHLFTSKDVERKLGEALYNYARGVDLENPEYTVFVEIRNNIVLFYDKIVPGPGGLPTGSEEPILVLFSGGFDSTVASWLIARRGSKIGLAFYDLGVSEAYEIALKAASRFSNLWARGWRLVFYRIDFTTVRRLVSTVILPEYRLLILRRLMLEHASGLAISEGYEALATGDNIGQVASQTVRNMRLIGGNLPLPVIRPVSGFDKDEIMVKSAEIGLYDIVNSQVEPCANAPTPIPRGSLRIYREQVERIKANLSLINNIINIYKIYL